MSDMFDYGFRKILSVSASDSPTPGGGSVSAMVGALGVSMAAMVGNLTVGKPKYVEVEAEAMELTGRAYYIMARLEQLMAADIKAFGMFMDTCRMPKNNDEEKAKREEAAQKALKAATNVPLKIAKVLLEALSITEKLARIGNKMAVSDAGAAAYVCEAALHAVLLNVDINVPSISDPDFVSGVMEEKKKIADEAKRIKELAVAVVKERML
jgi:formiminotetrahydrofolate cyclodeaminase